MTPLSSSIILDRVKLRLQCVRIKKIRMKDYLNNIDLFLVFFNKAYLSH